MTRQANSLPIQTLEREPYRSDPPMVVGITMTCGNLNTTPRLEVQALRNLERANQKARGRKFSVFPAELLVNLGRMAHHIRSCLALGMAA
jgi:hypothetical protein